MRYLSFLILSLFFVHGFSQVASSNSGTSLKPEYLEIRIGLADPSGDFGDKNGRSNSGEADNGINFEVNYQKFIGRKISWLLLGRISSNKLDKTSLDLELRNQLPSNVIISTDVGNWNTTNIMTGFAGDIELNPEKMYLRLRLLLGYAIASSPNINISLSDQNTQVNTIQERGKSTSLGFLTGADLVFKSSEMLNFTFGFQYYSTQADFDDIDIRTSSNTNQTQLQIHSFNQSINIIGLEVGVQFRL